MFAKRENIGIVGIFLFFAAFLVRRAVHVSLTYDEAASYLKFVRADVFSLFNFTWATNHFLNTVLARVFRRIGGDSELMLRMPALLGWVAFFWFSILVLRTVAARVIAFAGLLLLNLNPYTLDYFALSRGYGLWLGLQMGMVYFLLRFIASLGAGSDAEAERALTRAVTCAIGAVLANVAALNVYLSVCVIALVAFVAANRRDRSAARPLAARQPSRMLRALPWVAAGVFSALVFSQDVRLSPMIYEPVVVEMTGVTGDEAAAIVVTRNDVHNHPQELQRQGTSWQMRDRANVTGLRIQAPVDVARRVETIAVRIGGRTFLDDMRRPGEDWTIHGDGGTWLFETTPFLSLTRSHLTSFRSIINYRNGAPHAAYAIGHAAIVLLIMAVFALVLRGGGSIAARLGLVRRRQWHVIGSSALWAAAVAGVPTYLLVRDRELGFGETGSLLQAIRDFVDSSFYSHVYFAGQTTIAIEAASAAAIVCFVALVAGYRRRGVAPLLSALAMISLIVVITGTLAAERILFRSPYPMERTAVYFVPLCVLGAVFVLDAIAGINGSLRVVASALTIAAVILAAVHFRVTANVTSTADWPYDVETRRVIADLGRLVAVERHPPSPVVLSVYWLYWPAASVYATWDRDARIEVTEESAPVARDFLYVPEGELPSQSGVITVIKRYPAAAGVLAEVR